MKKKFWLILIIIFLIITLSFRSNNTYSNSSTFTYYEAPSNYVLVEKNEISKSFISLLYKDDKNNFLSKIYDYNTNEELDITDLVKEEEFSNFQNKIQELLYLKYPKFIADVLITNNGNNSYILRDNEMLIYFSNYVIYPEVIETLYLRVNYNEIKDYINFTILLDNDYINESGYNFESSKKSIAITFDDSPNKNKTSKILSYLQDNHFHATFFVVGEKCLENKDLLLNIKNSGNEIGSHTYSHQNMNTMSDAEIKEDFMKMNEIYYDLFQENIKLIRPPYGNIKKDKLNLIEASFILWSLDTNDWRYHNKDYLINYVLDNIKDGDIILFHDSYDSTVDAINELLPLLYSRGYQVMSVSELFNLKGISLDNFTIYHKAS